LLNPVRLRYPPISDRINIVREVTSPKESDAHRARPWVTPPYLCFYPPCERRHHFARNPPVSEFLPSESVFRPQNQVYATFGRETACPSLLRSPRLQTGIARCEQCCRTRDSGSGSATIFTLYFACFHTVERARKLAIRIVFAYFVRVKLFDLRSSKAGLVTARIVP
jgi:hypothetical protein